MHRALKQHADVLLIKCPFRFFRKGRILKAPPPNEYRMRRRFASWLASSDSKTRIRLRVTLLAVLDYAINVLVLFALAYVGMVAWTVPLTVLIFGVVVNALFIAAIASGASRRFHDPALTGVQVFAACAINLTGMTLAPHLIFLFVLNLFIPLSYSTLHFGRRAFLATWVLISAAIGAIMLSAGAQQGVAVAVAHTTSSNAFFWIVAVLTFGRFLAINAGVSELRVRLKSRNEELAETSARLGDLASRDPLTGLWNQREFMRLVQDESRRAVRNKTGFCVAVIAVDRYDEVKRQSGPEAAAKLLQDVAQELEIGRRATDSLARHGERELSILMPSARLSTATVALERTRARLLSLAKGDTNTGGSGGNLQYSISAGVAAWEPGELLAQVMGRAEAALARAGRDGELGICAARPAASLE
jgi:diguanylate cyclase (GGDEF)-like protein